MRILPSNIVFSIKVFIAMYLLLFIYFAAPTHGETILDNSNNKYQIQTPNINIIGPKQNQITPFTLKVLTYNILQTGVFDEWRDVIIEENSDIVVLQETGVWKSTDNEDFQSDLQYINDALIGMGKVPYNYYNITTESPVTSTGGAAILSRYIISEFITVPGYKLDDGTYYEFNHDFLHAKVLVNGIEVNVITVHFSCCEGGESKRIPNMEAGLNYIDSLGPEPFLYTGDFNTGTKTDLVFDDLKSSLDLDTLDMLLNSDNPKSSVNHTWVDTFRELNPNDHGPSYTDNEFNSRLDYIFANQFFFDKLVNSTVGGTPSEYLGSDHRTVDVTLNLQPELGDLRSPFRVNNVKVEFLDSRSRVKLNWDHVPDTDLESYELYKNDAFITSLSKITNEYIDGEIVKNQIQKYQVRALDNSSNKGYLSFPQYVNTSYGVLTKPLAPVLNGITTDSQITITWSVLDNGGFKVDSYKIFRATQSSIKDNRFLLVKQQAETTFIDNTVNPNRDYYYKVIATNLIGDSLESDILKLTTLDVSISKSSNSNFPIFVSLGSIGIMLIVYYKLYNRRKLKI